MYLEGWFYTFDHVVRGFIDTPQERLSDYLNIKNETTVIIYEAKISRLMDLGKTQPVLMPEVRLEKHSILFAYPLEPDMTQKSIYRRTNRLVHPVNILLPNFMLVGFIHLTEKFEIHRVLISRPDDFVPLTDATATYSLYPAITTKKSIMVFNKSRMVLIGESAPAANSNLNPPTTPR